MINLDLAEENRILPYVYKVTNILSGEFYIGYRIGNVRLKIPPEEDILRIYFTSGILKKEIIKDPENFVVDIIFISGERVLVNNKLDYVVFWYEQLLIRDSISNMLCLNKHFISPDTGDKSFSTSGGHHSSESKTKISNSMKLRLLNGSHRKGSSHTLITKQKMSESAKVRPPNFKWQILGNPGPPKGGKMSTAARLKLSELRRGKPFPGVRYTSSVLLVCPHCGKSSMGTIIKRWHFDNCKMK